MPLRDRHVHARGDDRPRPHGRGDRRRARRRLAALPVAGGRVRGGRHDPREPLRRVLLGRLSARRDRRRQRQARFGVRAAAGSRLKVAVPASGAGTNLQALLDRVHGRDGIEVVAVASDKADAAALARARAAGVATEVFPADAFPDRASRDSSVAGWLADKQVELVVLAGYMQLLSPEFLARFERRVINVHPALLPAFPGLRPIEQALEYGVKVFGVTVHFVDEGMDSGPVILQRAVELPDARDAGEVLERLHPIEHELLPEAVRLIARGAVRFDSQNPRRVVIER